MTESYTANPIGAGARFREFKHLLTFHRNEAENRVRTLTRLAEQCGRTLSEAFGFEISGRKILDVGPGQYLIQSRYFALQNEVVALDNELIIETLTAGNFLEMVRCNGAQRAVKTVARKALGVDRAYDRALRNRLGSSALPRVELKRGDACRMPIPDESFDMIYSRSVLHSLKTPGAALSEMARVLRAGGVAHVDLHLYSSFNGSLDPRILSGGDPERYYWAHLRKDAPVVAGVSLNKFKLSQWQNLFATEWPGSIVKTIQLEEPSWRQAADRLIEQGNADGYSRDELLTTTLVAIWQKRSEPTAPAALAAI
jgi:SAM-dependent methyltransferase